MKKAYVVLAHKNPQQVARLIRTLNDETSFFFIHVDRSSDIHLFQQLLPEDHKIKFVSRVKSDWGSLGLVQATLNSMHAIQKSNENIERIILLSGQDYPIKSNDYINRFFSQHPNAIYLEHYALPDPKKWKPNGGLYRVNKYFMGLKKHQRYAAKATNFMAMMLPGLQRKQYNGMKAFAGSMWWIINRYTLDYILDFVAKNPKYLFFHRFTFAADEVFFHMILMNAKDEKIASAIVNSDQHFIKWKEISSSHPEIITEKNLEELKQSDALFARKFDISQGASILDLIDEYCLFDNYAHQKQ